MKSGGNRIAWLLGNGLALVAFTLLAARWWGNGALTGAAGARGLAAYLNAASTLPILLLAQLGRLKILGLAGLVHAVALVRAAWARDWVMLALIGATLGAWVAAALLTGVRL